MVTCSEHSGLMERIDNTNERLKEVCTHLEKITAPDGMIVSHGNRISGLEQFRSTCIKLACWLLPSGGVITAATLIIKHMVK